MNATKFTLNRIQFRHHKGPYRPDWPTDPTRFMFRVFRPFQTYTIFVASTSNWTPWVAHIGSLVYKVKFQQHWIRWLTDGEYGPGGWFVPTICMDVTNERYPDIECWVASDAVLQVWTCCENWEEKRHGKVACHTVEVSNRLGESWLNYVKFNLFIANIQNNKKKMIKTTYIFLGNLWGAFFLFKE